MPSRRWHGRCGLPHHGCRRCHHGLLASTSRTARHNLELRSRRVRSLRLGCVGPDGRRRYARQRPVRANRDRAGRPGDRAGRSARWCRRCSTARTPRSAPGRPSSSAVERSAPLSSDLTSTLATPAAAALGSERAITGFGRRPECHHRRQSLRSRANVWAYRAPQGAYERAGAADTYFEWRLAGQRHGLQLRPCTGRRRGLDAAHGGWCRARRIDHGMRTRGDGQGDQRDQDHEARYLHIISHDGSLSTAKKRSAPDSRRVMISIDEDRTSINRDAVKGSWSLYVPEGTSGSASTLCSRGAIVRLPAVTPSTRGCP